MAGVTTRRRASLEYVDSSFGIFEARLTFLAQVGLSLLDAGHDHVSGASCGQPIQPCAPANDGNAVEVLRAGVVGAVHDRGHWETQCHAELVSGGSSLLGRHRGAKRGLSAFRAQVGGGVNNFTGVDPMEVRIRLCCCSVSL